VAPEHRGRGSASALLDAVDRECDALGVADVIVGALPGNVDAICLYERRGFRPTWMYLSRLRGGDACGRAAVARGVRGAYSIIEGKEPAALGALAVGPGALALAEGTLVGFVAHMATNPTSVRVRGASPLVACARRPPSEQQRERTSKPGDHRHPPFPR
jgi:hypothetical protein